jgi:putative endonuclease
VKPPSIELPVFTVYILYSPSLDRYYIGQTGNLPQRLAYHKAGSTAQTAGVDDWLLVFTEDASGRAEAMRLESAIKNKRSHDSIRRFIADPRNTLAEPRPQAAW